jgi:hypothetical protein
MQTLKQTNRVVKSTHNVIELIFGPQKHTSTQPGQQRTHGRVDVIVQAAVNGIN